MAYQIYLEHRASSVDGWCVSCRDPREFFPCKAFGTARRGFILACDVRKAVVGH